jgi:hypothetical protein
MSACGHHGSANGAPLDAATLIVSLDDMRRLTGLPGLVKGNELNAEPRQGGYGQVPVPCRAVSMMDVAFGQTWTQFKALTYSDSTHKTGDFANVLQAVGVYADDNAARAVFEQLLSNLQQCAALHWGPYEFSMQQQDPSSFTLSNEVEHSYRVKGTVVIEVTASYFPDSSQVASTVMRTISDRIPDA